MNAYSRGTEHLDSLDARDESKSVLWLLSSHHHNSSEDVGYAMKPQRAGHGDGQNFKIPRGSHYEQEE